MHTDVPLLLAATAGAKFGRCFDWMLTSGTPVMRAPLACHDGIGLQRKWLPEPVPDVLFRIGQAGIGQIASRPARAKQAIGASLQRRSALVPDGSGKVLPNRLQGQSAFQKCPHPL